MRKSNLWVALVLALTAVLAPAADISSAGSGFWTNTATWSPAQVPTAADAVTILNGHTITNSDVLVHDVGSLLINSGGILTHTSNTTTALGERYKVILNVATNLTIDAGGQINADGRGYSANNGPGKPLTSNRTSGSYGGKGGIEAQNPQGSGPTYGSITAPTNLGSGGSDPASGGGAVLLTVGGTSTVNGTVSADGSATLWGGSGGSVFLTTRALNGSGTIRAKGGSPTSGTYTTGGGGRVAVVLTNSMDFGNIQFQAYAGAGTGTERGAGGTVYLQHTNHLPNQGKLIVNYNDIIPAINAAFPTNPLVFCTTLQNGLEASAYTFSEIILTNGGVYALDTNDTLSITNMATVQGDPTDRKDGIYLAGGTLNVPASFSAYSNFFLGLGAINAQIIPTPASLTVGTNANMRIDAPFTLDCPLTIAPGGILDHTVNLSAEAYKINLTINGNLDVQAGGQVNVDGMGYAFGKGPGTPGLNSGAGYGGMGGHHKTAGPNIPGTTYGSITAPTNIGSGGIGTGVAGNGGGAVILAVNGATTLNGMILARAAAASYQGSGGTVFLTTGTLSGNGTMDAGVVNGAFGPGGGGRVSVVLTNGADFNNVKMTAYSYNNTSHSNGSPGTVYTQTKDQGPGGGTLVINAGNIMPAGLSSTFINSNVSDRIVGTVVISNAAKFRIDTNQTMTVNSSWLNAVTNGPGFFALSNSTVFLASTNAAIVDGTNTFYNLTCTNSGKTVRFTAGTTNFITGQLTLGSQVTLKSTVDNSWWYLRLALVGGTQQVGVVTVQDGNAGGGQELIAQKDSLDLGNNVNWVFLKYAGTVFRGR